MKIKPTAADVIMEILSLVLMIGVSLYIFIRWSSIPDKIPMHYNFAGEIDRWGEKGELLFLIAIAWGIWLLITVTERFPKFWNTGVEVTEKNREHVYRTLKYMVKTMKLIIVIIFTYLILHTLTVRNLPGWFLLAFVGLLIGDMAFWLIWLYRKRYATSGVCYPTWITSVFQPIGIIAYAFRDCNIPGKITDKLSSC